MNDIEHTQKKIMRFIIVSCIVLLGMMVTFLYDFSHRTFTHVRKQADIHLKELTEQEVTTVETKMNTCVEKAKDVAEVFGVLENPSDKEIETILSSMRKNSSFDQTFYVEKGGKSYSSDGVSMDADQLQNIKGVLSGKAGVSEIIESTSTGKKILLIYAPVTKGEEIVGVILGCFMIDNMADLVSFSGFDGEGYSFVIQQNGSVVLQTEHENKLIQGENFFRFLENTVNSVSEPPKNIEAQIKSKNAGYFTYQVGKETRYAYCCPTKFQDWCVISVVPGNVMKDYTSAIDRYAGMLALKLLVAFVVLLGFVIYLNLKVQKQIEKAHMDAESSRQKYALAMNHTDCQIFEYDITNHVVSNLSLELQKILHLSGTAEYSPEEMNIDRFFDPEQRKKIQDIIWEIRAGAEKIDTEVVNREGRWYKVSLSTIRPSKTIQVIGTIEDITYIHEMEQQYSQEEQYCTAMLREAAAGFSIDLITGTVLSSFQNGENYMELKKFTQYDSQMIQYLCACIHPEYQDKMVQLLMNKNLLEIHKRGVKEITEYFKTQLRGEEYIWVTSTVHFLNDPATAHPIIFSYMRNVNEQKIRELDLEYQSERDGLTGLYNRITIARKVDENLPQYPIQAKTVSALFMMDMDGFKKINDTYGHQVGDEALCKVAKEMKDWFLEPNLLARLGGDEFVVFIPSMESKEEVLRTASHFCRSVGNLFAGGAQAEMFTISIGIAFAGVGDSFQTLYKQADDALYTAKWQGKNRVAVYEKKRKENEDTELC